MAALKRVSIPSPNYSSRGGAKVRLIVLHTAEGSRTYQSLGSYFANPSSGVSSHVGIDDTPGTVGQYVSRPQKAWTQGNANPVAVSAELCAFAAWSPAEWDRHPNMLATAAAWIAEEAAALGIPIRKLTAAEAQGSSAGVCQHVDLGSWGGGHTDCGPSFPIDRVLHMAAGGAESIDTGGEPEVVLVQNPNNQGWAVLNTADATFRGFSSPDMLTLWRDSFGVPVARTMPTRDQWSKLRQAGTI